MTALVITDVGAALADYLVATVPEILDENPKTGGPAVFRPRLPKWAQSEEPLASIVIRRAGGYKMFNGGLMPVADPTLDFTCYAGSAQQADMIASTAVESLQVLTQSVWHGAILYWARISAGPIPLPDTQTLWPASWFSAQVMHSRWANPV